MAVVDTLTAKGGLALPTSTTLLVSALALYVVYCIAFWVYNLYFHPLASIPGPPLARASSIWSRRKQWNMRKAHAGLEAHQRYGSVVRLAPDELSFADPAVLPIIYSHGKGFVKSEFYARRKMYQEDHLFSTRHPGRHAGRRKLAAKTFSAQSMQQFEPIMNVKVATLMDQWASRSNPGKAFNVFPWLHWLGFEAMLALAFDFDAEVIKRGEPHWINRCIASWKPAFIYREAFGHWLNYYGHYLPGPVGRCFRDLRAWKHWSVGLVQQARKEERDTVYLSKMLKEPDSFTGQLLSDSQLAEEGQGLMFGGSGTTANTLVALIYAVLRHPTIYKRLTDEVRAVPAPDDGGILPYSVTTRLTYLNAVIKETLRRYPAIIGSQPRVATEDCVLAGVHVPKGTTVLVTNWTMHHSEEHFPAPDVFDPERWLVDDVKPDPNEAFNPFGVGPRACIGRNLAMMEISQTATAFFRRFDATLDDSMTDEGMILNDTFNAQAQCARLLVYLTERSSL